MNQVKLEDSFPKWIADVAGKLMVVKRPQFFVTWPSSFDSCILTVWHLAWLIKSDPREQSGSWWNYSYDPASEVIHQVLSLFSHVLLCVTLWTVACRAPLFMGFSRQEYWTGLPCLLQGIFQPRDQACVSCIAGGSLLLSHHRSP